MWHVCGNMMMIIACLGIKKLGGIEILVEVLFS